MESELIYPRGKDFIFTVFDDTDVSTLGNIKPVYDYLYSLGFLTTKSVWPLRTNQPNSDFVGSDCLEDEDYAEYVRVLHERGFEIAFHGASMESNSRQRTKAGLEYFYSALGFFPRSYACHARNRECLYWGEERFSFNVFKKLYRIMNNKERNYYSGEKKGSPYYWADMCHKHMDYVRTFTYQDINLLNVSRKLPYTTGLLSSLNCCFFTCDADNVEEFNRILSVKNQNKLAKEKGVCILSTHFGKGFVKKGVLHPKTKELLCRMSNRNGWFAPVSTVLDVLKEQAVSLSIGGISLFNLELKWFLHSIKRRWTNLKYEKTELDYLGVK